MGGGRLPLLMGMVGSGSGSSVLRAMSCHPEFKCNLEIARKGEGEREKKGVFRSRRGAMLSNRVELFVIPLRHLVDLKLLLLTTKL